MKKVFAIVFLFFCLNIRCFADSPPCWCVFEKTSVNGKYTAKIFRDSTQIEEGSPIFVGWRLTVFDNTLNKPIWTIDYDYTGYPDGYITDNGKSFVYVEYWYYEQSPLIRIYTDGKKINTEKLTGGLFNINSEKLVQTVSHRLWLNDDGEFAKLINDKRDYIEITTIDQKKHRIDLLTGRKI